MVCPSCQHRFRLKVQEYLSLRNRHHCPACGRLLKLKLTAGYFVVLFVWVALVTGVPYFFARRFAGAGVSLLVLVLCAVLFALPVDYLLQSYWLKSREVEHEKDV